MQTKEEIAKKLEDCVHPRVTEDSIKDKIVDITYLYDKFTTICIVTVRNGFRFVGHSTPADTRNFDPEIGRFYAYENAFKQIWTHEGYLLKQNLYMGDVK